MEKAMAPYSSTLAWKSHGWRSLVGCSQWGCKESDTTEWLHFHFSLSLFTFVHWRRKWQPIPVFLPGESQGRGSLVGCRLWGHTELDTTDAMQQQQQQQSLIRWTHCSEPLWKGLCISNCFSPQSLQRCFSPRQYANDGVATVSKMCLSGSVSVFDSLAVKERKRENLSI